MKWKKLLLLSWLKLIESIWLNQEGEAKRKRLSKPSKVLKKDSNPNKADSDNI